MEEAYSELYQQFLRLRALCLKQAALLQQLMTALHRQQGGTVPNGEMSGMSIAVQCTQHIPEYLQEKPEPPSAKAHGPAAQYGVNGLPGNVGTFSDLLAMDMSKLCVGGARQIKENQDFEQNIAPLRSLDSLNLQEVSGNLSQADHLSGGRTALAARMPLMDFPSQLDVLLMSDVALQSHVCEFCQAVFPGDTTTRGEFLRHLCTHIT